jgi:hypothetical protein
MPSTYTTNLGIEKIATGEQSGTWGNTTNTNLDILDQSIDGIISITLASAGSSGSPNSLPITDGAVSNGRNKFIEFVDGGDLGATAYVQLTPNDSEKIVHIRNSLSASRSIIVFQGTYNASNDYEILNGEDVLLKFDGAGAGAVVSQVFANLALPSVNIDGGTIDGATIGGSTAGAGTFTSLDTSAVSGIIQSNPSFIDTCLVGPSVDGKAWAGAFSNGSVWTSLMLATVETSGANAEVNIWDLTAGTLASATPLATLTLTGATPTSIAASMGYVIVGTSDQGFHIVDPHDGAWAERTDGWPRSLTASTTPALSDNNVQSVNATIAGGAPYDPRTGGSVPTFVIGLGATKDFDGIMDNGTVVAAPANTSLSNIVGVHNDFLIYESNTAGNTYYGSISYARDNASWSIAALDGSGGYPLTGTVNTIRSGAQQTLVGRSDGLISYFGSYLPGSVSASILAGNRTSEAWATAAITNSYNSGYMPGQVDASCVLAALANSKTADRSGKSNTLTENGTITAAAVETGAELMAYSGFSAGTNYLSRAHDTDFDMSSGAFCVEFWLKQGDTSGGIEYVFARWRTDGTGAYFTAWIETTGTLSFRIDDGSSGNTTGSSGLIVDDSVWHHIVVQRTSDNYQEVYVDGVRRARSDATGVTGITDASAVLHIGQRSDGAGALANGELSLFRITKGVALSANQVRRSYEAEKGMFAANAKCLLQGASDAVLDARIDPITGKYIVTQSDTQDIFDGLAIETERTIAAGGTTFEHGLLWGDAVAEINDANLFASTPATDQRQVNEMVRSMAAELPAGVDLSKAKAWCIWDMSSGSAVIQASYNVESALRVASGKTNIYFSVPFKDSDTTGLTHYVAVSSSIASTYNCEPAGLYKDRVLVYVRNDAGSYTDPSWVSVICFGELEDE